MENLVSVIIPVYNAAAFLPEAVESVLNQTYPHWELILVDDCSMDGSNAIARKYATSDERIRFYSTESNFGGPAGPRNLGLKVSRGNYIAFLDADDVWHRQKLEYQIDLICTEAVELVASNIVVFGDKVREWGTRLIAYPDLSSMVIRNRICTSSVLVKKSGDLWFDEDKLLIGVEDYHLWLTLISKGYRVRIGPQALVRYRVSDDSLIHKNQLYSVWKATYAILKVGLEQRNIGRSLALRASFQFLLNLLKLALKNRI
jgi:teichuronic acid biosynthesis glycosyltransferase TuaG